MKNSLNLLLLIVNISVVVIRQTSKRSSMGMTEDFRFSELFRAKQQKCHL